MNVVILAFFKIWFWLCVIFLGMSSATGFGKDANALLKKVHDIASICSVSYFAAYVEASETSPKLFFTASRSLCISTHPVEAEVLRSSLTVNLSDGIADRTGWELLPFSDPVARGSANEAWKNRIRTIETGAQALLTQHPDGVFIVYLTNIGSSTDLQEFVFTSSGFENIFKNESVKTMLEGLVRYVREHHAMVTACGYP